MEWIKVEDQKPPTGRRVLLRQYVNDIRQVTIVGFYAEHEGICANDNHECGDWLHYNEDEDNYYYPEGFYENIENWDDFSFVTLMYGEITHWANMPEPPNP